MPRGLGPGVFRTSALGLGFSIAGSGVALQVMLRLVEGEGKGFLSSAPRGFAGFGFQLLGFLP